MALLGTLCITISFILAVYSVLGSIISIHLKNEQLKISSRWSSYLTVPVILTAVFILVYSFVTHDFTIKYVFNHSNLSMEPIYTWVAIYAGNEGSLLYIATVISIGSLIAIKSLQRKAPQSVPHTTVIMMTILSFFLGVMLFLADPFSLLEFPATDGRGINPLLKHIGMFSHPPMLMAGLATISIPFAINNGMLISGAYNDRGTDIVRVSSLIIWLILGIGLLLGSWWAYTILGWGGYWAWDPVENASFMPWLTGTAFVHSIIIQEKKDMLKMWNMILIIITFILCIFGTYITRSGAVSSVHAFTADKFGQMFLAFVLVIIAISAYLVISRRQVLKSTKRMESMVSRESGFLFNNVIFVSLCFAVLWGTLFPLISLKLMGREISVSIPFYNQIAIPVGLLLLTLAGVGPLLAWRRTSKESLIRNFSIPLVTGLTAVTVFYVMGIRSIYPLMTLGLSFFVLGTISMEFYRGIRSRTRRFKESPFTALVTMISRNRSRYGGYIVHLGIVFMFIGFVGKAFDSEVEATMSRGEHRELAGYKFTLQEVVEKERPNHNALVAVLTVEKDNKIVETLNPEFRIYFPGTKQEQQHSELDLKTGIMADIYTVFSGADHSRGFYLIKIMINPLVWWVWFGGYFLVAGTIIAILPRKKKV